MTTSATTKTWTRSTRKRSVTGAAATALCATPKGDGKGTKGSGKNGKGFGKGGKSDGKGFGAKGFGKDGKEGRPFCWKDRPQSQQLLDQVPRAASVEEDFGRRVGLQK